MLHECLQTSVWRIELIYVVPRRENILLETRSEDYGLALRIVLEVPDDLRNRLPEVQAHRVDGFFGQCDDGITTRSHRNGDIGRIRFRAHRT
jgi:hypothetical protein